MMKYVLGTKERMTQVFDANGIVTPATVIHVTPHTVTAVKTVATDGYDAVQVATRDQKSARVAKAQQTIVGGVKKFIKEMRPRILKDESIEGFALGDTFDAAAFAVGDVIEVSAISKGKGFQGVVKRHGFHGDVSSHGRKRTHRSPGSIGATGMGRVIKGMRMAGRMGGDRITVKNLTVVQIDAAAGVLVVKGAVPGHKGTLVEVRPV